MISNPSFAKIMISWKNVVKKFQYHNLNFVWNLKTYMTFHHLFLSYFELSMGIMVDIYNLQALFIENVSLFV